MRTIWRFIGVAAALGLLLLVMGYLAGFFGEKIPTHPVAAAGEPVRGTVVPVERVTEKVIEQATGTIQAKQETSVSARILATIASIPVRAGDAVREGDMLVVLDSRELEARLEQQQQMVAAAEARSSEAEANYRRVKPLADRGVATRAELDQVEAALRAAQADLARARDAAAEAATALSYSTISAPFSGRVIDRFADPGDTATPGAPLLRLYDPTNLRLEANVRESLASGLKRGDPLTVRIDALNEEFPVTVDEIVPSADPGSRSFVVKALLPALPNLYPGMFGRLLIPTGTTQRLYIPAGAVFRLGQLEFVRVTVDDNAIRRYVRTGVRREDGRVEVLSGLEQGERVVLPPG